MRGEEFAGGKSWVNKVLPPTPPRERVSSQDGGRTDRVRYHVVSSYTLIPQSLESATSGCFSMARRDMGLAHHVSRVRFRLVCVDVAVLCTDSDLKAVM